MIPKTLEIENFFSYSNAKIDFTDIKSALIVGEYDSHDGMSNGAGKSAILQAIAFALYNKTKYKHLDSIIKRGSLTAKCTLVFEHIGKTYKVVRQRSNKYTSQNTVKFYEVTEDGEEIPFKADTNREVDDKIKEVLRSNYEVFTNTTYFEQGSISNFLKATPTQRQKLAASTFNLDRWTKRSEVASKKQKELEKDLSNRQFKLNELEDLDQDIASCRKKISEAKARIDELSGEEAKTQATISALEKKIEKYGDAAEEAKRIHELQEKYDSACAQVSVVLSKIDEKKEFIQKNIRQIEIGRNAILEIDSQVEELLPNLELKEDIQVLDEKRAKLHELRVEARTLQNQVDNLENSDICVACGNVHSDAEAKKKEILRIKSSLEKIGERIRKGSSIVNLLSEYADKVRKTEVEIDKYTSRKANVENSNSLHQARADSAKNELILLEESLNELNMKRESLKSSIDEVSSLDVDIDIVDLQDRLSAKRDWLLSVQQERERCLYELGGSSNMLEQLEKDVLTRERVEKEAEELKRQIAVYASLVRGFGKSGIQAVIIDNIMEELSRITNEWLNRFTAVPTYVEFITQKKDSKDSWKETLDIKIKTPTGESEFEGLSGGEAFRVAFSIRLALSIIQAKRMGGEMQLLMLDEVSTALDNHGLDMFVQMIRELEKKIKVLVITHNDALKEEFQNIIRVRKVGADSIIVAS